MTTAQLIEEALKEFDKEFTNSHPGDSGAGGNYPQEPVYELCESDPREYKRWLKDKLETIATKSAEKLEEEIMMLFVDVDAGGQVTEKETITTNDVRKLFEALSQPKEESND